MTKVKKPTVFCNQAAGNTLTLKLIGKWLHFAVSLLSFVKLSHTSFGRPYCEHHTCMLVHTEPMVQMETKHIQTYLSGTICINMFLKKYLVHSTTAEAASSLFLRQRRQQICSKRSHMKWSLYNIQLCWHYCAPLVCLSICLSE